VALPDIGTLDIGAIERPGRGMRIARMVVAAGIALGGLLLLAMRLRRRHH
jgi:hypothetical protein